MLENIIDTKQASELWGLSQDHIKRLCQSGEIAAKKIGNSWAIDAAQPNPVKYTKALQHVYNVWRDLYVIEMHIETGIACKTDCGIPAVREDFSNFAKLEEIISFEDMLELENNYK